MTSRVFKLTTANTTNLTRVAENQSVLKGLSLLCTTDAPYYVKFYWFRPNASAATPTVGTTVPDLTVACPPLDPATGADGTICPSWPEGVAKGPGQLFIAVTAAAADSDTTAVAAGQGIVSIILDGGP
jgi:hypothetical protein